MLRSVEGVVGRGVGWFSIFGEVSCLGFWVGGLGIGCWDRSCWRREVERGGGRLFKEARGQCQQHVEYSFTYTLTRRIPEGKNDT